MRQLLHTADERDTVVQRVRSEYERRARELPVHFYSWNRAVNLFFHTETVRVCIEMLLQEGLFPLNEQKVADIGCGVGTWLLEFAQWGADPHSLAGIDLSENRVFRARRRLPEADLWTGDACDLPWPDGSFDLVTQFTLFTSILSTPVKQRIAAEMLRVLKPGGAVLWYDFRFNNPRNLNVRAIEVDEIRSLFPNCTVRLERMTLAPPIARRIVPVSWILALFLEKISFLRTHYLGIIRKPVQQRSTQ